MPACKLRRTGSVRQRGFRKHELHPQHAYFGQLQAEGLPLTAPQHFAFCFLPAHCRLAQTQPTAADMDLLKAAVSLAAHLEQLQAEGLPLTAPQQQAERRQNKAPRALCKGHAGRLQAVLSLRRLLQAALQLAMCYCLQTAGASGCQLWDQASLPAAGFLGALALTAQSPTCWTGSSKGSMRAAASVASGPRARSVSVSRPAATPRRQSMASMPR